MSYINYNYFNLSILNLINDSIISGSDTVCFPVFQFDASVRSWVISESCDCTLDLLMILLVNFLDLPLCVFGNKYCVDHLPALSMSRKAVSKGMNFPAFFFAL